MGKKRSPQNRAAEERKGDGTFAPGASGNPGGRPKEERDVIEALRLAGVELAQKLLELAREGNVKAIEVALNRAYGKARERVELPPPPPRRDVDLEALGEKATKAKQLLEQLGKLVGPGLVLAIDEALAGKKPGDMDLALLTKDEHTELSDLIELATGYRQSFQGPFKLTPDLIHSTRAHLAVTKLGLLSKDEQSSLQSDAGVLARKWREEGQKALPSGRLESGPSKAKKAG